MTKLWRVILATIGVALVALGSAQIASAGVVDDLAAQAGLYGNVTCIDGRTMNQKAHVPHSRGTVIFGLTDMRPSQHSVYARNVFLLNAVCHGLVHWDALTLGTQMPTAWDLESLVTLWHEAAHSNGVRSERLAECQGVRGALYQVAIIYPKLLPWAQRQLLVTDERYRPAAYKLRHTCSINHDLIGFGS